jgi:hypothetical protein
MASRVFLALGVSLAYALALFVLLLADSESGPPTCYAPCSTYHVTSLWVFVWLPPLIALIGVITSFTEAYRRYSLRWLGVALGVAVVIIVIIASDIHLMDTFFRT